jgi:hypothetical protein
MTTKVLNRRCARWAELLASYDFVLIHIRGVANLADGPSRRPDYSQNVSLPSGLLIPPSALRLLPQHHQPSSLPSINVLFADLVGVHADLAPELRECILDLLPAHTGVQRYLRNPMSLWSLQGGLLLYHRLIYLPDPLHLDIIREHHDGPLLAHPGVSKTCELIMHNY